MSASEVIESISDLVSVIETATKRLGSKDIWFRGQADSEWPLIPSVHRNYDLGDEAIMAQNFRLQAPSRYGACPDLQNLPDWLALMRHYGLPTRLLDWTESAMVAAYFSVSEEHYRDRDGAFWVMDPFYLNALENRTTSEEGEEVDGMRAIHFLSSDLASPLVQDVFSDENEKDNVFAVASQQIDIRMLVQQSHYTIHGSRGPLEDRLSGSSAILKFVIPKEKKSGIMESLWLLGGRRSTFFPDLSSLAEDLSGKRN